MQAAPYTLVVTFGSQRHDEVHRHTSHGFAPYVTLQQNEPFVINMLHLVTLLGVLMRELLAFLLTTAHVDIPFMAT